MSVDEDPIDTILRRLEDKFLSKFNQLNEENERQNAENKKLNDKVEELNSDTKALKEIVNKQEILIQKLLSDKEQGRDENNGVIAAG